jgi:hypothetical protein
MYGDYISTNDDDLFESPSETPKQKEDDLSFDSLIKDVEKIFETEKNSVFTSIIFKSKVIAALNGSAENYVHSVNSFNRSIFDALNSLTQGYFKYQVYADTLEESIARRLVVYNFIKSITTSKNDKFLEFLSKKIKISFDESFFNTYLISMLEMMDYVIDYNISIYTNLCTKINRIPISTLLDRNIMDTDTLVINSNSYINKHFAAIRSELGMEI